MGKISQMHTFAFSYNYGKPVMIIKNYLFMTDDNTDKHVLYR